MALKTDISTRFPSLRSWTHDWGGILTLGSTVYTLLSLLWLVFLWGGETYRDLIGGLVILPTILVAAGLSWRVSTHPALNWRTRRAWRLIAGSLIAYWLGTALFWYYTLVLATTLVPPWVDVVFLTMYPLFLWGILLFPTALQSPAERVTFWLDAAIVLVGSGIVLWYLVLGPTVIAEYSDGLTAALAIAYPLVDILLVFGVAMLSLRKTAATNQVTLHCLLLFAILFAISDVGYGYLSLQQTYQFGDWPDAGWILAMLVIVFGAHLHYQTAVQTEVFLDAPYRKKSMLSAPIVPYLAMFLGYGLLLVASQERWLSPLGSVIFGAVVLSGLVVARQLTASRAMQRARADAEAARAALEQANAALDERVRERTATLEAALAAQEAQARALQESLATQEQLNQTIAALSVPIIPIQNDVLVTPLIGAIDSQRATLLLETVLERVQATHARQVFLDVTGVAVIDTQVAHMLLQTATALRLLGTEAVLVGIRPEVAHMLVTLGVNFSQLRTAATLHAGLVERNDHRGAPG